MAERRSEERLRSLMQHSSDLIAVVDAGGTVRYQSPSIERVLGFAPGELLGEPVTAIVDPRDAGAIAALVASESSPAGEDAPVAWLQKPFGATSLITAVRASLSAPPA